MDRLTTETRLHIPTNDTSLEDFEVINDFENEPPAVVVTPTAKIPDTPTTSKKVRFQIDAQDDGQRPSTSKAALSSLKHIRIATDIGIYMDETSVMVGRFNTDVNDVEILRNFSAEIAFVNGEIVIGLEAESYRNSRNHFYVHDLLKIHSNQIHNIEFPTGRHSISTKTIHSSFFKQLGKEIMEITQTFTLGNACLTIPFPTTSIERQRFKSALAEAGFLNPRILSSLSSTAIAFAKDYKYYLKNTPQTKLIFVAQCLKTQFSMAVMEISPFMIKTRSSYNSNNMPECRDGIFPSLNEQLYNNLTLDQGKQEFLQKIYQKAIDQVHNNVPQDSKLTGVLIVKAGQKNNKLDCIFKDIFGHDVTTAPDIGRGPLLGAALLASKSKLSVPLLPEHVDVFDSSRTNLVYSIRNRKSRILMENQCFLPREVFRIDAIIPSEGATFTLSEEYSEDGFSMEVCKASIYQASRRKKNKSFSVILQVNVDENGIYSVNVTPMRQ